MQEYGRTLLKFRVALCLFIVGLILSGVTAFPFKSEIQLLVDTLGLESPDRARESLAGWAPGLSGSMTACRRLMPRTHGSLTGRTGWLLRI